MAFPEIDQQQGQPEIVQQVPEQVEIPAEVEQGTGVQATPSQPQALQFPNGQIAAQPVPTPHDDLNVPTFKVTDFENQEQVEKYSQGNATDSITWKAVGFLRLIHQKALKNIRVIFGGQN